jgi:hypothetical protein
MLRASTAINQIEQNHRRLSNAQRIGDMGDWEWDLRRIASLRRNRRRASSGMRGRHRKRSPARSSWLSCTADERQRVGLAWQEAIASGSGFAIDHRIVQECGATRHVHQQVEVLEHDDSGRPVVLAGAIQDITAARSRRNTSSASPITMR